MAGFWGRRKRERDEERQAQDAELGRRAERTLVETDERIRTTGDELAFAEAEIGAGPTVALREGLDAVREHLGEAFHLHQLNHDEIPDTPEELRTRHARIVQLCEWANDVLDERTEALRSTVQTVREAPQMLAGVRTQVETLRGRLPDAEGTIERLGARYSDAAMNRVSGGPAEAAQLLDFALHSAEVSERRRSSRQAEEANLALETATEAVRRAESILDGVEDFEIRALRAQSTLAEVIADSRSDITEARAERQTPEVTAAVAALEAALAALPAPGVAGDPFDDLARLSEANAALDRARERAARPVVSLEHVRHAVEAADHSISVASSLITGHRGWIGADARTRLAEAQRTRAELDPLVADEDTREQAMRLARRAGQLGNEALQLAQRDIDSSRPDDWSDWGGGGWGGGRRGGVSGGDVIGGIVGGALLGGLLGDIFD